MTPRRALAFTVTLSAALGGCGHGAPERRPAPAAAAAPAEPEGIPPSRLSPGQVRLVQRALAARGFAVEVDGRYDAATEAALKEFQRIRGLPASAALGPSTIESLGLDARDLAPRPATGR